MHCIILLPYRLATTYTIWVIVHDHVLDDHVAVEFVRVGVLIATTAVLIGPLYRQIGTFLLPTLPVFLQK